LGGAALGVGLGHDGFFLPQSDLTNGGVVLPGYTWEHVLLQQHYVVSQGLGLRLSNAQL